MIITEAVVHGIEKAASSNEASETSRPECSPIDSRMNSLCEALLTVYSKTINNYGTFNPDHELYRFPVYLEQYSKEEISFLELSHLTNHLIATKMAESFPATGGYSLFIRYENSGRQWLLIVMLKLKPRTGIDLDTLELNDSFSFDIEHLHEAARVDLQKWRDNEHPYLSFIKRSGRQDEVTRYFRHSVGCTEYIDSKHNTNQLLNAVDNYCLSKGWTPDQKKAAREVTYSYCDNKSRANEPVNLIALSAMIDDQSPTSFTDYIRENNLPINDTFSPHRATFNRFKRIKDQFRSIKVSFDVEDIINQSVDYDSATNGLIIRDIPESLKTQIMKAKGNEVDPE